MLRYGKDEEFLEQLDSYLTGDEPDLDLAEKAVQLAAMGGEVTLDA